MSQPLQSYRGTLSPAEIASGMNAALRNAQRLLNDAKLLLDGGRYPTASSLAVLAIEEAGKRTVLRSLAVASTPEDLREAWRDYRSHRAKNCQWILADLFASGARRLDDYLLAADKDGEHTALLDAYKQIGFYTDCVGERHWSEPEKVISEEAARKIVQLANALVSGEEVTVREVELWVQYLGFVKSPRDLQEALLRWGEAMEREGLAKSRSIGLRDFVLGMGFDPDSTVSDTD